MMTLEHRYVTSTASGGQGRSGGGGPLGRASHIIARRLDYLPDGWLAACGKVIRGAESAAPVLRVCPRCTRRVGG